MLKHAFSIFTFFLLSIHLYAQTDFYADFYRFQSLPELKNSSWALKAINLTSGDVIADINSDQSLIPASTMKIITTGIALDEFGPDYRFQTQLAFRGKLISDSVLEGDLLVIGGGDPTFHYWSKANLNPVEKWIRILKNYGIKHVSGDLIVDISRYPESTTPDTWVYQDIGNYYGASPSALTYANNTFMSTFAQSPWEGIDTEVLKPKGENTLIKIINKVKSGAPGSGDNAYVYGFPGSNTYIVRGTIPPGNGTFSIKASMPDPPMWFLSNFRKELTKAGIITEGEDTVFRVLNSGYSILDTFFSPPLGDIIQEVNVNSNNLFAEHLQIELSLKYPDISIENLAKEYFEKEELNAEGLFPADGSGLSRYNAVTASNQVDFLSHMHESKHFETYLESFPVGGKNGTVADLFRSEGKAVYHVKSGTLSRVKAYAGYIEYNNELIAFSFIVNNYSGSTSAMKKSMETVLLSLVRAE
jgi:D-alanyl-D-alanine carboxypeptidase/D-alanyl-D-alanine-endopeptidase (penicillin-binding protein 4)